MIVYVPKSWDFVVCREMQVWLVMGSVRGGSTIFHEKQREKEARDENK